MSNIAASSIGDMNKHDTWIQHQPFIGSPDVSYKY